jgi:hypothetical protein
VGWELLPSYGIGKLTQVPGRIGRWGRYALYWDTAQNAVQVGRGGYDIYENGLTWANGLQVGTGLLGLGGNYTTWRRLPGSAPTSHGLRVASAFDDVAPITGGPLSETQADLLSRLHAAGGRLALCTGEITTTDIAALTHHTGLEFALIRTSDGQRQLIELGRMGGDLPNNTRRLILHSHVGGRDVIPPSGHDVRALARLGQRWSLIVNSEGTVARFDTSGEAVILKLYLFGGWRYPQRP